MYLLHRVLYVVYQQKLVREDGFHPPYLVVAPCYARVHPTSAGGANMMKARRNSDRKMATVTTKATRTNSKICIF